MSTYETTVLIDANNVGYAFQYATKLKSGNQETQAIFGFAKALRDLRVGYRGCKLVILWDGRAQWRFDLCSTYKSNRDNDAKKLAIRESYVSQRPYIAKVCEHLGVRQMTATHHEADDLAGLLTTRATQRGDNVVLYTGDRDWLQLIRPGVIWRDPGDLTNYVTPDSFHEKTGYATPMAFLQGKALQGDTSDVIDGIPWMGDGTASKFMAKWGSVNSFFRAVDRGEYTPAARKSKDAKREHPEQLLAALEGRKLYLRNLRLMQLLTPAEPAKQDLRIAMGKFDRDAFAELCESLAFSSILRDLDNFTKPFQEQ